MKKRLLLIAVPLLIASMSGCKKKGNDEPPIDPDEPEVLHGEEEKEATNKLYDLVEASYSYNGSYSSVSREYRNTGIETTHITTKKGYDAVNHRHYYDETREENSYRWLRFTLPNTDYPGRELYFNGTLDNNGDVSWVNRTVAPLNDHSDTLTLGVPAVSYDNVEYISAHPESLGKMYCAMVEQETGGMVVPETKSCEVGFEVKKLGNVYTLTYTLDISIANADESYVVTANTVENLDLLMSMSHIQEKKISVIMLYPEPVPHMNPQWNKIFPMNLIKNILIH